VSTILIVDDEKTVRSLLLDLLEIEGHHVIEAADGPEALYRLHCGGVDLVLLDVMMPGMSGIEVLSEIRRDEEFPRMPVMMLTAAGDDVTTWAGLTAGADVYLEKPFDQVNLLGWIDRLLLLRISVSGQAAS
jgi:DNA-binding response OmpR family regulator